jgi:transcription termination factor NusB
MSWTAFPVSRKTFSGSVFLNCSIPKSVPPKVAISEAIRLARKFATAESAQFVNAVLDSVYHAT